MDFEQKHQSVDPVSESGFEQQSHNVSNRGPAPKLLKPGSRLWYLKHWLSERLTKRQVIIGGVLFVALFGGGLAFALSSTTSNNTPPPAPKVTAVKPPVVVPITSPLTGLPVSATDAQRPVTAVMVENSDAARPQAGLSQAGVVFEALAEGGITRFMALYQETQPSNIGPIRSLRPYYLQWAMGFDAAVAHVGGSPQALTDVNSWSSKDINEFYYGSSFHRISTREAPHNVYTSIAALNSIESSKGWTTSKFTGFPRKDDSPSKSPDATSIDLNPSYADFAVNYSYNPTNNSYLRSEGGAAHMDSNTGTQIEPKVVIAMVVPLSRGALDATGAYYSDYQAIGTGPVYVFQDGTVTTGTWSKAGNADQIEFSDANKNPIKLNAGQTWITALASNGEVTYK
jgi:hypothetical protein